jgi:hypothetical protein
MILTLDVIFASFTLSDHSPWFVVITSSSSVFSS